jgi:hypothetical protein
MSTALITINQSGKPAGVSDQSRDDLALYTGPGTEIQLSYSGVGATTFQWLIIDQPPGATATLSTPTLATTNLVNATVAGSYLIQLVVDGGGSIGQITRRIAAIQMNTPSWVTPSLNRPLRIPATSETNEFNVDSSPGSGTNLRGWALEMDHFFRTIVNFAFGTIVSVNGVQVGTEAFRQINFSSAFSGADAGSGQVDIGLSGSVGGISNLKNNNVAVAGSPFTTLDSITPDIATSFTYQPTLNVQFENGSSNTGRLIATAGAHQDLSHAPGIVKDPTVTQAGLATTVNTGPNPMTVAVAALNAGGTPISVVTKGRVVTPTQLPSGFTVSLASPGTTRTLYDVYLKSTDLTLDLYVYAQTLSANAPAVLINTSPNFPTGSYTLAVDGAGLWTFGGGESVLQDVTQAQEVMRLYLPNAVDWVEIYRYTTSGAVSDSWTINACNPNHYLPIFRAPYWLNPAGSVSTWGWAQSGTQRVIDTRPYGTEDLAHAQDSILKRIDLVGADQCLDFGVVFSHKRTLNSATDQGVDSFALTTAGGAAPANATGITGGAVWIRGRRYEVKSTTLFSSLGLLSTYAVVGVTVGPNQTPAITAVTAVSPANLISFVRAQVLKLKLNPTGQDIEETVFCPLYFGSINASSVMVVDERIDLRRNVGSLNTWTVGTRTYDALTAIGTALQGSVAYNGNMVTDYFGPEYESVASALLWHGVITGSNNLERNGGTLDNPPTKIEIIRDTYETFPITLWNNVSIRGCGFPAINITPRGNSAYHGAGFLYIGGTTALAAGVGNQLCYNVEVSGVRIVATAITGTAVGTELLKLTAPKWDNTNYTNVKQPYASLKNVKISNVEFAVSNGAGYVVGSGLAAIRVVPESGTAPFTSGFTSDLKFDHLELAPQAFDSTAASTLVFWDTAIHFAGTSVAPQVYTGENTLIEGSDLRSNVVGLKFASAGQKKLRLCNNKVDVLSSTASKGLEITDSKMQLQVVDNIFTLTSTVATAYGVEVTSSALLQSIISRNTLGLSGTNNSLSIGVYLNSAGTNDLQFTGNRLAGFRTGFSAQDVTTVTVAQNTFTIGTASIDGSSRGLVQSGLQTDFNVRGNTFIGFREAIELTGSGACQGILVAENTIRGQIDYITEGSYHARGVLYTYSGAVSSVDIGLVIRDNLIQDLVGDAGVSDPYGMPGGGIIVGTSARTGVFYGVTIKGNTIRFNHGVSRTSISTMWAAGIYCAGNFAGSSIRQNHIINNDTKFNNTALGNNGIVVDNAVAYAGLVDAGVDISDNTILWMSCNAVDSGGTPVWDKQAGISLFGRSDLSSIKNNTIKLQCRLETAGSRYGYMHGILVGQIGTLTNAAQRLSIVGNTIEGCQIDSTVNIPGTVGAAIQVAGNAVDIDILDNSVKGIFVAHPSYTIPALTSLITVAVEGSAAHSGIGINNNKIVGLSSAAFSGVPGAQLGAGIRVGSTVCATSSNVSIRGNHVDVELNSNASLTHSGAIVLEALDAGVTTVGSHAIISANFVKRTDQGGAQRSRGIKVVGYNYGSFKANKVVHAAGQAFEVEDIAGTGSVVANNWGQNHCGQIGAVGTHSLDAASYLADPVTGVGNVGTNTDGAIFF